MNKKITKVKKENGLKRFIPLAIIILVFISILAAVIISYFVKRTEYKVENIATVEKFSDNEIRNSNPIVIGNILMGSWLGKKWIPADQYAKVVTDLTGVKAAFFDENGKIADNELGQIKQDDKCYWVRSDKVNTISGFFATTNNLNLLPRKYKVLDMQKDDMTEYKKQVKSVISLNGILNTTVKLYKVLEVSIVNGKTGYLVVASNDGNADNGVYSMVLYIEDGKSTIVKLDYNNDKETRNNWAFYDVLYLSDLNADSTMEIVLQEVKGMEVKQSILEYKDSKFLEVLSAVYVL